MAFVKLDCGILNSTLWVEREQRDVFITALLMAAPFEVREPMEQYEVDAIKKTGFVVPTGWYGFVEAAGPGIVRRALADPKEGMEALRRLGDPDEESRSSEFDGRRLVRVDGGYIVLNYMKYRDKDATAAVRSARYRERKKLAESEHGVTRDVSSVTRDSSRRVTIAEAEAKKEETPRKRSAGASAIPLTADDLVRDGLSAQLASEWIAHRNRKRAKLTQTAWDGIKDEANKAGWSIEDAIKKALARGWQSFDAAFVVKDKPPSGNFAGCI